MDDYPPNVARITAPPFSLDAARRRLTPAAVLAPMDRPAALPPRPAVSRRHPRLELVAGSAVPEATPDQITDARDRFLNRLAGSRVDSPVREQVPSGPTAPSAALLLRRAARLVPYDSDPPRGA